MYSTRQSVKHVAELYKRLIPTLLATDARAKRIINVPKICSHFTDSATLGFNISEVAPSRLTEIAAAGCCTIHCIPALS
ncbi:hypothetical protein F4824DRAFT_448108 [Ustulina deusta]|nr:hypothetical protein F4824DRAFT_448108 [Ustulina deusta]